MARLPREDSRTAIPQLEKRIDNNTKEILDKIASLTDFFYPIGTVYETLNGEFDPNKTWGGEWERIKGKTLVGVDEDDTDFADGASGGSKGAWKHNHTMASAGDHTHRVKYDANNSGSGSQDLYGTARSQWSSCGVEAAGAHTHTIDANGSTNNQLPVDKANMPPYVTVYMWKRIA